MYASDEQSCLCQKFFEMFTVILTCPWGVLWTECLPQIPEFEALMTPPHQCVLGHRGTKEIVKVEWGPKGEALSIVELMSLKKKVI